MRLSSSLILWIVNTAILYIVSVFWNNLIVFGNAQLSPIIAAILTGLLFTIIESVILPLLYKLNIKQVRETPAELEVAYFLINIAAIWILARFASVLGFGIASFWVAIILGVGLSLIKKIVVRLVR